MTTTNTRNFAEKWVWAIAALVLVLHLATAGRYDFFRNELYFIICGRHPAFGYADQPPLVPMLAAATQLFGENLFLLRLPAAIAAAGLIPITAALATMLGGGRSAAIGAALAAATAPGLTAITSTLGTSTFEPLGFTLTAYFLLRAMLRGQQKDLLWAALTTGIIFQSKYGIALWAAGLALGLLFTDARRLLTTRQAWLAAALAAAIALPNIIWQALHGFPFAGIVAWHSQEGRIYTGGFIRFLIHQVLAMNMLLAPLWLTGLIAPFVSPVLRPARALAIAFAFTFAIILAVHGKDYYLFPAFPTLFAVGATAISRLTLWVRLPWAALTIANAAFIAPITLPLLSPPALFAYMQRHHLHPAPSEAAAIGASITQLFSDEMPWRNLESATATAWRALPDADRRATAIFAWNYGEASALNFYGTRDGLPPVISAEDQYFLWGPRFGNSAAPPPTALLLINIDPETWRARCGTLQQVASFGAQFAMPYENGRPIFFCRALNTPLATLWSGLAWSR